MLLQALYYSTLLSRSYKLVSRIWHGLNKKCKMVLDYFLGLIGTLQSNLSKQSSLRNFQGNGGQLLENKSLS